MANKAQTITPSDYQELMTEIIQKQIVILGPDISLLKAREVSGLEVADDGTVTRLSGDAGKSLQALIDSYVALAGMITKSLLEPLVNKYPQIAKKVSLSVHA